MRLVMNLFFTLGRFWPFSRGRTFLFNVFSRLGVPKDSIFTAPLSKSTVKLSLPFGDDSARRLLLYGEDDSNLYSFLLSTLERHPGTFLDIGAHYGEYSIRIAKETGSHVIAVEPQPNVASKLKENASREGVFGSITLLEVVAGPEEKSVAFYESSHDTSLSKVEADGEGEVWRKMLPLYKAIPEDKWKGVSLVKIDVEGFEKGVFQGLLPLFKHNTPIIVFEANKNELSQRGESLDDILLILKDEGYEDFYLVRKELKRLLAADWSVENVAAFPKEAKGGAPSR